jgi:hypothetical protein
VILPISSLVLGKVSQNACRHLAMAATAVALLWRAAQSSITGRSPAVVASRASCCRCRQRHQSMDRRAPDHTETHRVKERPSLSWAAQSSLCAWLTKSQRHAAMILLHVISNSLHKSVTQLHQLHQSPSCTSPCAGSTAYPCNQAMHQLCYLHGSCRLFATRIQ